MKKSLIALAVLAASGAAMAQSSVTLFGIVDVGVGYIKNSGGNDTYGLANSGLATSRLGFRGVEDLGGGLKAGFWLEGQIDPDTGGSGFNFKRRSTLSVMGNFGEVRLGRDLVAGYKTSSYDLFGQVGMGQFLGWSNAMYGTTGDANGIRADNLIGYHTNNIAGFMGGIQYGFGENAVNNKSNRYLGAYLGFNNGPLSVTLAGDRNNFGAAYPTSDDRTQLSLGAAYDLGMLKVSGLVQRVEFENVGFAGKDKYDNWLLGVSAPVGPGTIKAQYASYNDKSFSNADAQQLSVGYQYDLSKRTAVYTTVAYLKNKNAASTAALGGSGLSLGAVNGKNQTGFQVGVRHAF